MQGSKRHIGKTYCTYGGKVIKDSMTPLPQTEREVFEPLLRKNKMEAETKMATPRQLACIERLGSDTGDNKKAHGGDGYDAGPGANCGAATKDKRQPKR
jgi:hypothetical protein